MRKILFQGEMDGACFLYAACNAYYNLSKSRPTPAKWNELLKWIPFKEDFLTSNGTLRYDEDISLYEFALARIFRELAHRTKNEFELQCFPSIGSPSEFANIVDTSSVVITNIDSEHWVVVVESSVETSYIACSYQMVALQDKYFEKSSSLYKRPYNQEKSNSGKSWVHNPSTFKVSLKAL